MQGLVSHPTFHVLTTIGVCMVACFHAAAASCQLRVGTFNIRCVNKNDKGARSWDERRGGLAGYELDPDNEKAAQAIGDVTTVVERFKRIASEAKHHATPNPRPNPRRSRRHETVASNQYQ